MKLEFAPAARADLFDIADYIARDNPARAVSFVEELKAVCKRAAAFPEAAPMRPEIGPGIRVLSYAAYLVLYRAVTDALRIERIVHGSRALPDSL